jgi:xanthine dehydrogenase accessory factor
MKALRAAILAEEQGQHAALVTVISDNGSTPRSSGARMLVRADETIVGTIGGGNFEHQVIKQALEAIQDGKPRRYAVHLTRDLGMCCGGAMEAFIEPIVPRDHLVIYGAGHVGTATAHIAARLENLDVTVVDDREDWIDPGRFPGRVRCIEQDFRWVLADLPFSSRSYHFIVTHSHPLDQDLVEAILPREAAWVGLIASKAKVARFLIRLRAAGMAPALFTRLCAPVGLDIGAETPDEIAISVLAEITRVRRGATQPPLPMSQAPLPARGSVGAMPMKLRE